MPLPVMSIDGEVIAAHSYWTEDGSAILTRSTVRTADGQVEVVQLGGSVDGIGMRTMPGPALLVPGQRVALAAHKDVDLANREHIVLDSARVLAEPPGFVRTGPTKNGKYLFWESGCVNITIDQAGTTQIAGDEELAIIDATINAWNNATASCSYLTLINAGREDREVGRDSVNLIKFRDTEWCRPATGSNPKVCHPAAAAGITTAIYVDDADSSRDGAILDADIELNGVNFAISANGQSLGTAPCRSDLQNTLTHEVGHLQGLEHPCLADGDPQRKDDQGATVPSCSSGPLPAKITDSTMYNFQSCGETKKSSLSQDDIDAICRTYPVTDDPGTCESAADTGGCCSASDGSGEAPAGALLLAGAVAMLVLRRKPRA